MSSCTACGFQLYQEGKACPACGSAEQAMTIVQERKPSVEIVEPTSPSSKGTGGRYVIPKGRVIGERYQIQKLIGRGGMGSVYEVQDLKENRVLALKILTQVAMEDDSEQRFMREFEMLSKMNHPAVLKVYGWGRYEDQLYFVSEFVSGRDLKSEIKTRGPWPADDAAKLAAVVADALAVAHSMGIVHRDIKPHNIMIANDGSVRLLDFGVARKTGGGMETLTKTGMIVGTPEYMSPEQFGTHRVDERSDLYSLGVILYRMVSGERPFYGSRAELLEAQLHQPPPPPSEYAYVSPQFEALILKALAKDPAQRFQSGAEFVAALDAVQLTPPPPRTGIPQRIIGWLRGAPEPKTDS